MSNGTFGVPKGSVFVPVLFFCISMREPQVRASSQRRFLKFADHTTVFASDSDINNVHAAMNRELVGVDNWFQFQQLNSLALHLM